VVFENLGPPLSNVM